MALGEDRLAGCIMELRTLIIGVPLANVPPFVFICSFSSAKLLWISVGRWDHPAGASQPGPVPGTCRVTREPCLLRIQDLGSLTTSYRGLEPQSTYVPVNPVGFRRLSSRSAYI
jgi:hypothetical protein